MLDKKAIIREALNNLIDALNKFLIIIVFIFVIISFFMRNFFLDLIKIILIIVIFFRIFSKNRDARKRENERYIKIRNIIRKPFTNIKRNWVDRKKYVYKKCRKCKTTLKLPLPKNRGINHATCPNCKKRVTLFTIRKKKPEKIKVEVIKKK